MPCACPTANTIFYPGAVAAWLAGDAGVRGATDWVGWAEREPRGPSDLSRLFLSEPAPRSSAQLEAQLLNSWWCHCLYGRQGQTVPPPGDPPHLLCPAYQEEEEAGLCRVSDRNSLRKSGPDQDPAERGTG